MDIKSVKARFFASYAIMLFLFIIQIPIIYLVVGGMSEKYYQVETAGSLRKRAVELTGTLSRHILTGNEALEKVFRRQVSEYDETLGGLKNGSSTIIALKDPDLVERLSSIERKWEVTRGAFNKAMEQGDSYNESRRAIDSSTAQVLAATGGDTKAKVMKQGYLLEKYFNSSEGREALASEIKKSIAESDAAMKGNAAWDARKKHINSAMESNEAFHASMASLADVHTPQIVSAANDLTKRIAEEARGAAIRGIGIMIVSVLLSSVAAVIFMVSSNKQFIQPLVKIKETVEGFASGDLTRRADIKIRFLGRDMNDEITSLGASVDEMAGQMSGVLGRITDSSSLLASAANQLSTSSTQITDGADRQFAQTQQVATAMDQMNATVVDVARNSQHASESARQAQQTAERGGGVVTEAIGAMQEVAESTSVSAEIVKKLGKSSEQIGTIVSVINDIADQTNLLALNAAIEAARAGDQGRGFAVVADEVRKLAERTTKATKEISEMIKSIQEETSRAVHAMDEGTKKVENGVKLAHEAGDALHQIVTSVESVTDMIGQIATASEEQSATTDEITQNMESIAEVAKSNVSSVGEMARATGELASLATGLNDLVSGFRTSSSSTQMEAAGELANSGLRVISGRKEATVIKPKPAVRLAVKKA